jgi:hypothetical protein
MRPTILIVLVTAFASLACGAEKNATSTTALTGAEARALSPPGEAVYINPQRSIDQTAPVDQWRTRYPHSARVLDEWAATYPLGASRLAAWSAREPEKLEVLVLWSVTRPLDSVRVFLIERPSWEELGAIARDEPEAVAAFLHWAHRSRGAAEELAMHAGGLAFVEPNL